MSSKHTECVPPQVHAPGDYRGSPISRLSGHSSRFATATTTTSSSLPPSSLPHQQGRRSLEGSIVSTDSFAQPLISPSFLTTQLHQVWSSKLRSSRLQLHQVWSSRLQLHQVWSSRLRSSRLQLHQVWSSRLQLHQVWSSRLWSSRLQLHQVWSSKLRSSSILLIRIYLPVCLCVCLCVCLLSPLRGGTRSRTRATRSATQSEVCTLTSRCRPLVTSQTASRSGAG